MTSPSTHPSFWRTIKRCESWSEARAADSPSVASKITAVSDDVAVVKTPCNLPPPTGPMMASPKRPAKEPFNSSLLISVNDGTCRSICQRATTLRENSASSVTTSTLCCAAASRACAFWFIGFARTPRVYPVFPLLPPATSGVSKLPLDCRRRQCLSYLLRPPPSPGSFPLRLAPATGPRAIPRCCRCTCADQLPPGVRHGQQLPFAESERLYLCRWRKPILPTMKARASMAL